MHAWLRQCAQWLAPAPRHTQKSEAGSVATHTLEGTVSLEGSTF